MRVDYVYKREPYHRICIIDASKNVLLLVHFTISVGELSPAKLVEKQAYLSSNDIVAFFGSRSRGLRKSRKLFQPSTLRPVA